MFGEAQLQEMKKPPILHPGDKITLRLFVNKDDSTAFRASLVQNRYSFKQTDAGATDAFDIVCTVIKAADLYAEYGGNSWR